MKRIIVIILSFILKRKERYLLSKCYTSIDELPIYYWRKIQDTNNLSFLIKSDIVSLNKKHPTVLNNIILSKLWENIFDEYIKMFGFSEEFLEIHRKRLEQASWRLRMIAENNKSHQNFINICQVELDAMMKANEGSGNFYEMKAYIESSMHLQIDEMRTSVAQYYSYIKAAQTKAAHGRGSD